MIDSLLGLLCLGIVGFGVITVIVMAAINREGKNAQHERAELEKNKDLILDEIFDGRLAVTYESTDRTLSPETLIEGAAQRGYILTTNTPHPQTLINSRTLTFHKQTG